MAADPIKPGDSYGEDDASQPGSEVIDMPPAVPRCYGMAYDYIDGKEVTKPCPYAGTLRVTTDLLVIFSCTRHLETLCDELEAKHVKYKVRVSEAADRIAPGLPSTMTPAEAARRGL